MKTDNSKKRRLPGPRAAFAPGTAHVAGRGGKLSGKTAP
jgi:hypothetical protein